MLTNSQRRSRTGLCIFLFTMVILGTTPVVGRTVSLVSISDATFQDNVSDKIWQTERSPKIKSVEDVTRYLEQLNGNGNEGWRLPTKDELYGLFSRFDLKENGEVKVRLEGKYWLRDDAGLMYVGTWEIGDQCEPSRSFYKGTSGYIRAVRP